MQLFIVSQLEKKGDQIFLSNVPELLAQLRKVLRTKIGDVIFVQNSEGEITRYQLTITDRTDKDLEGKIINEQFSPLSGGEPVPSELRDGGKPEGVTALLIAMPNKREKAELIVQKLSEIGVDEIAFWPAERSVIKQRNEKKADRLHKIAKEAVEQSRGRNIPKITWCENMKEVCTDRKIVVFDRTPPYEPQRKDHERGPQGLQGVIGPEGGFTEKDYQLFQDYEVMDLGETVLRMETAAIIGGWTLKNLWRTS